MVEPYIGEIRTVGFAYAPRGWAMCSGQVLPIAQHSTLFSLLGVSYGGDGRTTFALPNLNGAFAIGQGEGPGLTPRPIGASGGATAVTLLTTEMPPHTHSAHAVAAGGNTGSPAGRVWAQSRYGRGARNAYAASRDTTMDATAVATSGGSQPHNNMPPYLGMYHIIALSGIYPPRE